MRRHWICSAALVLATSLPAIAAPADDVLAKVKAQAAPDTRITLFQVEAKESDETLFLTGRVLEPEQRTAVLKAFETFGKPVKDGIEVFPFPEAGQLPYAVASKPLLNIRANPRQSAELVTQTLMGQTMKLLRHEGTWWQVQLDNDGYIGWAEEKSLVRLNEANHKYWRNVKKAMITQPRTDLLSKPRGDADVAARVYMNTRLPYLGKKGSFAQFKLPDGRQIYALDGAWKQAPAKGDPQCVPALIQMSKRLLGAPYLWGGTSPVMMDCSGFTQQLYRLHGWELPRDADQQQNMLKPVPTIKALKAGDLVFFPGHTGLYIGNQEFIHSSVGNAGVAINSFNPKAPNFNRWYLDNYKGGGRVVH